MTLCSARKDKDYLNIQLYTEDGLEHGASLTRGDQLLIALLVGGDYDGGVPGCGIEIAHKVALHSRIGEAMLHVFLSMAPEDFSERAKDLVKELYSLLAHDPHHFLQRRYKAVVDHIPDDFPQHAVISKYVHPLTSFSATRKAPSWDVSSFQPDLVALADLCRQQLGWDDSAIIKKMYGGVWEGTCLRTFCKVSSSLHVDGR